MTCKSLPFFLLGLACTVGTDQAVKYWVMSNIPLGTEKTLLPFLSLYHVRNSGIAFSFLSSFPHWGLIAITFIMLIFLLWIWKHVENNKPLTRFGLFFIIGGAIGNLIDRVFFHYVTDYIFFYVDNVFYFAVFNLADSFITIGAIIILFEELRTWIKIKRHSNNAFLE